MCIYAYMKVRYLRVHSDTVDQNCYYTYQKEKFSENYGFISLKIFELGLRIEATLRLTSYSQIDLQSLKSIHFTRVPQPSSQ